MQFVQQAVVAQLEGSDLEMQHFAPRFAGSLSCGKQVAQKVVFYSLAVANSDDSDDVWVPKMLGKEESKGFSSPLGKMQRARLSATMSSLQGRDRGDRQDEWPALTLARRVSLSSCGFGTLDVCRALLGARCFFTPADSVQHGQPSAL